jgi:hypothetical protein
LCEADLSRVGQVSHAAGEPLVLRREPRKQAMQHTRAFGIPSIWIWLPKSGES